MSSPLLSTTNEQGKASTSGQEARYKRPLPSFEPFKDTEGRRVDFDKDAAWKVTKTIDPDWKIGSGANKLSGEGKKWVAIDPNDRSRDP